MADSSPSRDVRYNGAKHTVRVAPKKFTAFEAPRCPTCDKSVYAAEQVLGPASRPFHKLCLKCTECGALLSPTQLLDHEYQPYCKNCHGRLFGIKGVGFGNAVVGEYEVKRSPRGTPVRLGSAGGTPTSTGGWGSARSPSPSPLRPSTRNVATDADEAENELPDMSTLRLSPSKSLGGGSPSYATRGLPDDQDRDRRRDVGDEDDGWRPPSLPNPVFSVSARPASPAGGRALPIPPPRSGSPAAPSPPRSHSPRAFSPPPGSNSPYAARPSSPLKNSSLPPSTETPVKRDGQPGTTASPIMARQGSVGASSPSFDATARSKGLSPGPAVCPRCQDVVYFAEQVLAVGKKWHKRCLRCVKCTKALDAGSLSDRDGQPYCKKCYSENFGNEAQGFVLRAGFSSR